MGWCRGVGPHFSQCHPGTAEGSSNGKIGPFVGDVTQLGRKDPSKDPSDPFSTHQALTKKRFRVVQSSESIAADCSSLQVTGVRKYDKQYIYIYIYTHTVYVSHISEANLCGWRALCKCCWIWSSSGGAAGHFVSSLIHMLSKHIFVHLTFCFTFLIFLICFDLLIHEIRSITKGRKRDHGRPANQAFDFDGMVVKRSKKDFQWLSCWISLLRSCFFECRRLDYVSRFARVKFKETVFSISGWSSSGSPPKAPSSGNKFVLMYCSGCSCCSGCSFISDSVIHSATLPGSGIWTQRFVDAGLRVMNTLSLFVLRKRRSA